MKMHILVGCMKQGGMHHKYLHIKLVLGIVAQELREYEQARADYQQALQIKVEFGDRYSQASNYGQLGSLAEEEGNLAEARTYLQQALELFVEFKDEYSAAIVQRNIDATSH
jgi:tetratricopeptide (TPR) repeat protein